MLLALVLIVATDTAPAPVSAAPRSLSDYALEHRGLLRGARTGGVGGFSAAESTIPRASRVFVPAFDAGKEEPEQEPTEPEVVAPPVYGPVWWVPGGGRRPTRSRIADGPGHRTIARRFAPQPFTRHLASPTHEARLAGRGRAARP